MVSAAEIERRLRPDKHRLDDELELQPEMAYQLSRLVADMVQRVEQAKDDLKVLEARKMVEARMAGDKVTDKSAESTVVRDPERRAAFSKWLELKREQDCLVGLQAAWRERGYALTNLANLHGSDYFAQATRSYGHDRPSYEVKRNEQEGRRALRAAVGVPERPRVRVVHGG